MRSTTVIRIKRTSIALLLMFVLSFTTVFAETENQTDNAAADTGQTEAADVISDVTTDSTAQAADMQQVTAAVNQTTTVAKASPKIIKKGKNYYYQYASGKIRKKKGFVTVDGNIYYVKKGGKIKRNATFKVKKKTYRANKYGVIKTGVYKWKGKYYYANSKGQLRKKEGLISWNGNLYYVKKNGKVKTNCCYSVNNVPYIADSTGVATRVVLPAENENAVIEVARNQVGIMTGQTYWVWYYKTKFKDTDRTPWCGAFVAWVYNEAGLYDLISVATKYGPLGYVPSYSKYANKNNKWINKEYAKAGDIIVFGKNRHVGLVEAIYGNYIITIEGNAGPTAVFGSKKPGAVVRNIYSLNSKDIKGVIRVLN